MICSRWRSPRSRIAQPRLPFFVFAWIAVASLGNGPCSLAIADDSLVTEKAADNQAEAAQKVENEAATKEAAGRAEQQAAAAEMAAWLERLRGTKRVEFELKDEAAIEERLRKDLKYLASDALEGRGLRTRGLELAADHIAIEFAKAGLETNVLNGEPFQSFQTYSVERLGEKNRAVLVGPDRHRQEMTLSVDYLPLAAGISGDVDAPLVFVGYGISAPDLGYDDYAGIDVRGKVAVMLRHEPRQADPESVFDGVNNSPHAYVSRKITNAVERGAVAVVLCSDKVLVDKEAGQRAPANQGGVTSDRLLNFRTRPSDLTPKVPVIHMRRPALENVLTWGELRSLSELEAAIDADLKPQSFEIPGVKLMATTQIEHRQGGLKNVIGILPGAGDLAEETVVVGAHYDHLGMGGGGSLAPWTVAIHNGADDNGSGTTGLLEIARQVAARAGDTRRRIVFIAFSAEESGLIGSQFYVRRPAFPLEQTVAMVNLDMVGRLRNERVTISGVGTAAEFSEMLTRTSAPYQLEVRKDPSGYGPSDHASFHARRVPVLHFFTGLHADYHRPSDDFDKINYEGIRRISLMATDVVLELAESEKPVTRRQGGGGELEELLGGDAGDLEALLRPQPVLGVRLAAVAEPVEGVKIVEVYRGTPAEAAQLREGDVIVEANGAKVATVEAMQALVRGQKPGDDLTLLVRRGEIDLETTAKLRPR